MARIKLHSEHFAGLNRENLRARLAALRVEYPTADINARRQRNYGNGYSITVTGEGSGRIQTRGHCQFCGAEQVVKHGKLVLHGYERPGNGWTHGRCPGVREVPLQASQELTERWLESSRTQLEAARDRQVGARAEEKVAQQLWIDDKTEKAPPPPRRGGRALTEDERERRLAAYRTWEGRYPIRARAEQAGERLSDVVRLVRQLESQITHFETLLGWKLLNTPLPQREV